LPPGENKKALHIKQYLWNDIFYKAFIKRP